MKDTKKSIMANEDAGPCGVEEAASMVSTGARRAEIITRTLEEGLAFLDRPGFVDRIEEAQGQEIPIDEESMEKVEDILGADEYSESEVADATIRLTKATLSARNLLKRSDYKEMFPPKARKIIEQIYKIGNDVNDAVGSMRNIDKAVKVFAKAVDGLKTESVEGGLCISEAKAAKKPKVTLKPLDAKAGDDYENVFQADDDNEELIHEALASTYKAYSAAEELMKSGDYKKMFPSNARSALDKVVKALDDLYKGLKDFDGIHRLVSALAKATNQVQHESVDEENLEEAALLPNEKKAVAAYAKAYVAAEKSKEGKMSRDAVKKTVAAIKKALNKDIAKAGFPSLWHFSKSSGDGPFVFRILFHANEKDKDPRGLKAWLTLNGFVNVYQTNLGDGDYEVGAVKNYADRKLGLALNKHLFPEGDASIAKGSGLGSVINRIKKDYSGDLSEAVSRPEEASKAFRLGREARFGGMKNTPLHDARLMGMLRIQEADCEVDVVKEWQSGWHKENGTVPPVYPDEMPPVERSWLKEGKGSVPPEVAKAWKPHLSRVKQKVKDHNNGYYSMSDKELISDIWDTAKAAGWRVDEIVGNPRGSIMDVVAIWNSN